MVFQDGIGGLFACREHHHFPAAQGAVAALFCALYFVDAVHDAVNGVADDVGACLPDFVQYQQAVIARGGGIGKAYFRAAPRQQATRWSAPYAQGCFGGGGLAVG